MLGRSVAGNAAAPSAPAKLALPRPDILSPLAGFRCTFTEVSMNRLLVCSWSALLLAAVLFSTTATAAEPSLKLKQGDKIVLIGNTLAERMQYYNHWKRCCTAVFLN